jgi:hypothetical protein
VPLGKVDGLGRGTIISASFACDDGPKHTSGTLSTSFVSVLTGMSASSRSFSDSSRSERRLWLGEIVGDELEAAESMVNDLREVNGGKKLWKEKAGVRMGPLYSRTARDFSILGCRNQVLPAQPQSTGDPAIGTVISIGEREPIESLLDYAGTLWAWGDWCRGQGRGGPVQWFPTIERLYCATAENHMNPAGRPS